MEACTIWENQCGKILFREIKRTFGRFIAIFAIVAIGVAFFAGVTASSNDMKNSTDNYYDDYNMSDLRLLSSIGFNEDDIKAIRAVDGVKGVYPAYSQDAAYQERQHRDRCTYNVST